MRATLTKLVMISNYVNMESGARKPFFSGSLIGLIRTISFSVTELCEYAANVDIAIARESIRAVGKIALQQYDVNAIVDRLLQFLEMEKDYVTAETLVNYHMNCSRR